jgi:hypothetical protein
MATWSKLSQHYEENDLPVFFAKVNRQENKNLEQRFGIQDDEDFALFFR